MKRTGVFFVFIILCVLFFGAGLRGFVGVEPYEIAAEESGPTECEETHTITVTVWGGGEADKVGTSVVNHGDSFTVKFTPYRGNGIVSVRINGEEVEITDSFTFENVTQDHEIEVTFVSIRGSGAGLIAGIFFVVLLAAVMFVVGVIIQIIGYYFIVLTIALVVVCAIIALIVHLVKKGRKV